MRILVVDDDVDLIEGLRWYLEAEGLEVLTADDGEAALDVYRKEKPDLVILDIMMPKLDGMKVCEIMSQEADAMIMMLSAKDGEIDKVRALKIGADDYVTKPFHMSELVARIEALARRKGRSQLHSAAFKWQNLALYPDERRVTVNGIDVELTAMEFDMLTALMTNPSIVLSREHLIEKIWGNEFVGEFRLVDNLVYRLREKLSKAGCSDFPISTVRGVGYAYRPTS